MHAMFSLSLSIKLGFSQISQINADCICENLRNLREVFWPRVKIIVLVVNT